MGQLDGRVAIVTGAGQGIGRGIALRYAKEGARVLIAEWNDEKGPAVAKELEELGAEALFIKTDVGVKEQVDAAVDRAVKSWGTVDILVNNAWSGTPMGRVEWKTTEELERALRVGFLSNFWSMQAVFPHMKAKRWGRIINLCSLNGVNAHMYTVPYNTAKEAVRSLTRTAAREWAPHGICCNIICPAAATEAYVKTMKANPEMEEGILAAHPMHRMGDPEDDIAPVAVFLASEDCRYLTGNTLFVDGGSHINGSPWAPELPDEMPSSR